jgi:cold shock CspA family protein
MSKARENFNKKEKEKQKLKKKQEKEEKREARKANSPKADLEEMFAYVDENGNISSTPPDPTKKVEIDPDTIKIGVARQEQAEMIDPVRTGMVTFFNSSKGYGFIKDQVTQESIFVHARGLVDEIQDRDKVTFEVEMTPRGPSAVGVRRIS